MTSPHSIERSLRECGGSTVTGTEEGRAFFQARLRTFELCMFSLAGGTWLVSALAFLAVGGVSPDHTKHRNRESMQNFSIAQKASGRLLVALLPLLLALVGCAYASWDTATRSPGYAVPRVIPIWVDITEKVLRADGHGYTSTMIQTLEEGLVSRGFEPHIFTPTVGAVNEARHLPRVEIVVRSWDEGNRALRVLSPVGGEPALLVECVVLSADNKPIFAGRLTASQNTSGWESPRDAADTAAIAGELLARTVAGR